MKNISSNKIVSCTALAVAVAAVVCCGVCKKTPRIGLLNSQQVFEQADVFRQLNAEQEKYVNAMLTRRAEDEKMLQNELNTLQRKIKSSPAGENAFAKEIIAFREKVAAYNLKYRQQRALIAYAGNVARQQVEPMIQEVFSEMGESGYAVIMPKSATYYSKPCLDATEDFIKRLNKKEITVAFPDPALFLRASANQNNQAAAPKPAEAVKQAAPAAPKPAEAAKQAAPAAPKPAEAVKQAAPAAPKPAETVKQAAPETPKPAETPKQAAPAEKK